MQSRGGEEAGPYYPSLERKPYLISCMGLWAFSVLKMNERCFSRCRSCSQVESLLLMKERGHSFHSLGRIYGLI